MKACAVKGRRSLLFCLLCLMLCLLLAACGGGGKPGGTTPETPETPETPGTSGTTAAGALRPDADTLVIAIADEVEGLDVQQISWANFVHDLIYEPLVVYSTDLSRIDPAFAESYTATDDYLEFVLPEGARFSNGDPLDAEAVKASFERFLTTSEMAEDLEPVTSIRVMDERTVRFELSSPAPYLWSTLGVMFGGVVDTKVAEEIGEWEFNRKPVTNGTYYVDEWVPGSHITLKRNEYFSTHTPDLTNGGVSHIGTVVVRFIPDGQARVDALLNGDVDIILNVPPASLPALKAASGVRLYDCSLTGVSYLNLQTEKGLLSDVRVRQALTYAVDRDAINAALGGIVAPTYGLLSDSQFGHSEREEAKLAQELAYDPARAKALLAEAGWTDPDGDGILNKGATRLTLEMMIPSDNSTFQAAGPILKEQFAAVGVDAQIVEYEADYIKELMRADEYEIGSRTYEWMDAIILSWAFTKQAGYQWEDPELTELLDAASVETDTDARVRAYELASDRLASDFKAISLYSDGIFIAASDKIEGFVVCDDGRAWVNDVVRKGN
ncbi:MAG: ABC transporter substrate-binding protein [Ruminococcaceae bacterium]|nr:ABC transporter substrate-binding protein [Oscillospiraceae bacterium]